MVENTPETPRDQPSTPNSPSPAQTSGPASVRIVTDIPIVYADGIVNHVVGPGVCKFYLYRSDADPKDPKEYSQATVVQVVMPVGGFVEMAAFFEHRLRVMVKNKAVTQEYIEERRKFYANYPTD